MAGEILFEDVSGKTCYAVLRDAVGRAYNTSSLAFESYLTANYALYKISCTEQGSASGVYAGTMPSVGAGIYTLTGKEQAGGTPAEGDLSVAGGDVNWAGSVIGTTLAATGLNAISVSDPGGVATTFAQMVVQLWRRFFRKTTLTTSQLLTYDDLGTTVRTTQAVSDTGSLQTQDTAT